MTYKILLPVEDKCFAKAQVDFLCRHMIDAGSEIILFSVIHPITVQDFGYAIPHTYFGDLAVEQEKLARKLMRECKDELELHFPNLKLSSRIALGNPVPQILELAKEEKISWIIIGSHGRKGLEKFFLGSVSQQIVNRANCSVTVVRIENTETECEQESSERQNQKETANKA